MDTVFAEGIASWRRIIENSDDQMTSFSAAGREVARMISHGLSPIEAADAMTEVAQEFELDIDQAQAIIARAINQGDDLAVEETDRIANGQDKSPPPPLPRVDLPMPLTDRAWLNDFIPMFNVTLFSGEGAVGKSIALLQLAAATVLGKDWFGTMPDFGPVLYIAAEEDDDELRRRVEAIAKHYHTSREELQAHGLTILSFAGRDATLGKPDKFGMIAPTSLLERIRAEAISLRPKLIVFDTVADIFGGKEIDRTQTRQFITLLRGLAIDAQSALIMASHPSIAGIRDDTGISGSTAWHNSVRARLYFKAVANNGDETTARTLEIRKNNYGPVTHAILVIWCDGVFVLQPSKSATDKAAVEKKAEDIFCILLIRLHKQGRNVCGQPSRSYAPSVFAEEDEAKKANLKAGDFKSAMQRLFEAGKIKILTEGPPSRRRSRLCLTSDVTSNASTDATVLPFQRPSNASNDVCAHTPPYPHDSGSGLEGREGVGTPSPTRPANVRVADEGQLSADGTFEGVTRTAVGIEILGAEPAGTTCKHCGKHDGIVYLVRRPFISVRSEQLHEKCIPEFFKGLTK